MGAVMFTKHCNTIVIYYIDINFFVRLVNKCPLTSRLVGTLRNSKNML